MKSVGEVMAIGSTFKESFQKAIRGLEIDKSGLDRLEKNLINLRELELFHQQQKGFILLLKL